MTHTFPTLLSAELDLAGGQRRRRPRERPGQRKRRLAAHAAPAPQAPAPAGAAGAGGGALPAARLPARAVPLAPRAAPGGARSEEHTSELQSLMRISYAVFCLKTKKNILSKI